MPARSSPPRAVGLVVTSTSARLRGARLTVRRACARRQASRFSARDGAAPVSDSTNALRSPGRAGAGRSSERGQASVEFIALLPLIVLALFAAWQFLLAGDALWHARTAARAAARAHAVGDDAEEAARDHLPERLERALRVSEGRDGDVRVSVHVPAVLHALDVGRVAATGHFDRQGS